MEINCTDDEMCHKQASIEDHRNIFCVDSVCRCGPNHNMLLNFNSTTNQAFVACQPFLCESNEQCQRHDKHRDCQIDTGRCLCGEDYKENLHKKCVYYKIPTYKRVERKYLNKNRISYQENQEQWHPENDNKLTTYLLLGALIIAKIGLGSWYVIRKRRKKLLNTQRSDGQEFGQVNGASGDQNDNPV